MAGEILQRHEWRDTASFVALANPGLIELITRKIGESRLKDLNQLWDLEPFADDAQFQEEWREVKLTTSVAWLNLLSRALE